MAKEKDGRLRRAGVSGYNKPKRTLIILLSLTLLLQKKVTKLKPLGLDNKVKK